jgi:hypothetical protein
MSLDLLCVLGSLLLEVLSRRFQSGGKGIGARDFGLCQNMAIGSFADVSAGEITHHFKLSHVDSVKGKCVMVNDGVVPGGSGAVVTKVGALHVGVVRKPAGKVIDTLAQAAGDLGTLLAACRYSVAVTTSGNLSSRNGNIQEEPMKELNTSKRSGNLAALLVYVIGKAGDIYVMADEDEGFGGLWDVLPLELGIAVLAEREVVDRINPSEGELGGYWTPVLKALTA